MNFQNECFTDNSKANHLEKQVQDLKKSRDSFQKQANKWRKKFEHNKPYFDTMARHNDRLRNEIEAMQPVLEKFRAQVKEICPHKPEWIDPKRETDWSWEGTRHYCGYCHSFIKEEEINREI